MLKQPEEIDLRHLTFMYERTSIKVKKYSEHSIEGNN